MAPLWYPVTNGCSASEEATTATDHISSLPDDILHHILSFLEIKHAVGTSILSNRWRYLWTFNPNLDFPDEILEDFGIINQCFQMYNRTSINRLSIMVRSTTDSSTHVETLVRLAIIRGIRELSLLIFAEHPLPYLPESLFSHSPLTILAVSSAVIDPPLEFKGFPCLKELQLLDACVSDEIVEILLLRCPLLHRLIMVECKGLMNLSISVPPHSSLQFLTLLGLDSLEKLVVNAPNLLSLSYCGNAATKFCVNNVPRLREANVGLDAILKPEDVHEWRPLLKSITHVNCLIVQSCFSQFVFAEYCVLRNRPNPFMNLKELHWSCFLASRYEIIALATFFRNCPLLNKLYINIIHLPPLFHQRCLAQHHYYWELFEDFIPTLELEGSMANRSRKKDQKLYLQDLDYVLPHLKTIHLSEFSGINKEMDLVKFLLGKATTLDSLVLTSKPNDKKHRNQKLQEKLTHLSKASIYAKNVLSSSE